MQRWIPPLVGLACLLGCPGAPLPGTDEAGSTTEGEGESSDDSDTTASLDAESESESESQGDTTTEGESEGDTGDPVHVPAGDSLACTISPGDHSTLCPEGEPCPIVDDVEIQCDGHGLNSDAEGVVVDAERTYAIGQSEMGGWLFAVQGQSVEITNLPDPIDDAPMRLTGDQDSGLHMLATTHEREHIYLVPDADGFLLESIAATPRDDYTRPLEIAVDSLDRPHIWVRQEPGVDHGIREDDWTLGPSGSATFLDDVLGLDRLDRQVELINMVTPPTVQLVARVDGVDRLLGDPVEGEGLWATLGQPIRPSDADPGTIDFAVAYQPWLLRAIWPVGESDWQEVEIAEAVPNLNPCPTECPCGSECVDDLGGVGLFQVAQASGDELWLAWTNTYDNAYYLMSDWMIGQECLCWTEAWGDTPTSSFHLARIDTSDGSYERVLDLTLPSGVLELDIHVHERRLGVRMYTRDTIQNGQARKLRVLGLDLDAF
jgi:hypothetical protein